VDRTGFLPAWGSSRFRKINERECSWGTPPILRLQVNTAVRTENSVISIKPRDEQLPSLAGRMGLFRSDHGLENPARKLLIDEKLLTHSKLRTTFLAQKHRIFLFLTLMEFTGNKFS
jgi:hypothetical protein